MSREKKNKRELLKRDSEKVKEETYEEISEAMIPSIREGQDELMNLVTWEKLKNTMNFIKSESGY